MSDAVFIVTGPFSGDGTGNAVAFGNGPDGWGLLVQSGVSQLRSSGTGSGSSDTGQYLSARFTGDLMETAVNSGAFSNAFGSGFPVRGMRQQGHVCCGRNVGHGSRHGRCSGEDRVSGSC
ncbi:hypothetical protein ACOT81_37855 [Streptomyces sp. WI04-05B]|uniref:hypothetical protein n=1 Tax=Streptomyces TaxID=1883 RepID=UPI0039F46917